MLTVLSYTAQQRVLRRVGRFCTAEEEISFQFRRDGPGVFLGDGQTVAEGVPDAATRCYGICFHKLPDLLL